MGKVLPEVSSTTMATKVVPTSEQLRLAVLCMEKPDDQATTKHHCLELMKLTGCAEGTALVTLHECDNVFEVALNKILDRDTNESEWQTTGKKSKKSHNHTRSHTENSQSPLNQKNNVNNNNNSNTNCNGEFASQNDDPSQPLHQIGDQSSCAKGSGSADQSAGSRKRTAAFDGAQDGGFNSNFRDPSARDSLRPSRGRGRGFLPRGGRSRGRGGGGFGFSDFHNGGDAEFSSERSTESRFRGSGRRGFFGDQRGGGRGGNRGGRRFDENSQSGYSNGMNTWSNETESNTWDNSMAGKWNSGKTGGDNQDSNQDTMVVDNWKDTSAKVQTNCNGDNSSSSNTWDNSMAQGMTGAHSGATNSRRRDEQQHRGARSSDNYGGGGGGGRQQHHQQHGSNINGGKHRGEKMDSSKRGVDEDWNHDDWAGEEVEWQKMSRVFVNMNQQPQQQQNQNQNFSIDKSPVVQQQQQQPHSSSSIPSASSQAHVLPTSTANSSSPNTAAGGGGGNVFVVPTAPNGPAVHQQGSEGLRKQPPPLQQQHQTTAVDSTGTAPHVRGESIDVKLLFGQQKAPAGEAVNDSSSGSWTKQATDAIKNELGIGKVIVSSVDQLSRTARQFTNAKPAASKVELPNSVPIVGKIDVQFGEFASTLKMRSGIDEQQPQNNYYEFGTATSYAAAEKGAVPQSTAAAVGPTANDLLYGAGSVASNSYMRQSAAAVTAADQQQQQQQPTQQSYHQAQAAAQPQAAKPPTQSSSVVVNNSRSPSMLQAAAQQQPKSQTTAMNVQAVQQNVSQQPQPQRSYIATGTQSALDSPCNTNQVCKDSGVMVNPSMLQITLPSSQGGLAYCNNSASRTLTTNAAGKPTLNTTAIFNPATNASYQALAAAAAMPFIYPTAADQNYLNALQFLSPAAAAGYPFSALGTLPFELSSLNLRDSQQAGSNDGKQYMGGRTDVSMSGANTSINAPPGLGPASVPNAEQQAAQLLTPAAAAAAFSHPYQLMQAPFYTPFVVPTVTNSSASTVNTVNQYNKNFASAQPMFYGSGDLVAQDYTKNIYGMNISAQQANQNKPSSGGSNMNVNQSNDVNSKGGYAGAPALKMFDGKNFQQNTATPPPGMGGVAAYPPGATTAAAAAAAAYHSSNAAAAAVAAYGPYAAQAQFLPPHQINMLPPNMAAAAAAAQAQAVNANDVMNSAGNQRGNAAGNKASNAYATSKNNAYWAN